MPETPWGPDVAPPLQEFATAATETTWTLQDSVVVDQTFATAAVPSTDVYWGGLASMQFDAEEAGGAVTGTGSIAFAGPAFASDGLETFTGSAAVAFAGPALASTATETFTGTAAVVFAGPALDGTGTADAAGVTGTGVVAFSGPALASTALETFDATGALAFAGPALAASGSEELTGAGAVVFAVAALSGEALESFAGAGAVVFAGPALDGGVPLDIAGDGDVAFKAPSLDGLATGGDEAQILGGGRRYMYPPYQQAPEAIEGIGALVFKAARLSGLGALAIAGAGATELQAAAFSGDGGQTADGCGVIVVRVAIDGAGVVLTRRLVSAKAGLPARSISGAGIVSVSVSAVAADLTVTHLAPDAIDRAWHDLQADEDELIALGVLT